MLPSQIGFFSSARVTGVMQGLKDPRLFSVPLTWNQRVPDVPSTDEEITANFVGQILVADMIADDAKAVIYSQGRFQFQSYQVLNLKMGIGMNQAMINALQRIKDMGGIANDDVQFFTNRWAKNVADVKEGVEIRKELCKLGMLLDGFSYDRLGIKMYNVSWGMYSDLKVTPSTAWSSTSSTPISDIQSLRNIALQRYGINLNRATMSTAALRAMTATTEFANQVKNVFIATSLGASTPAVPYQSDQLLKQLLQTIISTGGEPFTIEVDDRRYWSQGQDGKIVSNRIHPINKVLLTSTANDGNGNAYDWANCVVTESIVGNMFGGNIAGGPLVTGRGPIGYTTLADNSLNPPGTVTWGVARGVPRKHNKAASAVLTVGTLTETYDPSIPAIV